jgi:hypothetical protein
MKKFLIAFAFRRVSSRRGPVSHEALRGSKAGRPGAKPE